ncbi:putative alcohol dehydrogenase [Saitoella complicata NRRL Y-17804]|nr:putative alcohol dehydrogenase [Saitoella complicata NRRL Y-17804]ODQ55701.1 putative alcohol dehydrogenase [Saitoella complicata NRRL Y-17804]
MKAVVLEQVEGAPGKVWYPLKLADRPVPQPSSGQVLVKILAAALNHRDLFCRQNLYPGVTFDVPLGADAVGVVVQSGSDDNKDWVGKRVVLVPGRGWEKDPEGPEGQYAILGGTKLCSDGTFVEYLAISPEELVEAPRHLSNSEAAALPLGFLTAYRAVFTKSKTAKALSECHVLITGIGGGVAISAMQLAIAAGALVFVTSGSQEKIDRAKSMGAAGGVNYKSPSWQKELRELLPKTRPELDIVIDSAGGDIVEKTTSLLRRGGIITTYGMTTGPKITYTMAACLKNIELRGSTMGSKQEFRDMIKFVANKNIRPVVERSFDNGFAGLEDAFSVMKNGSQFGKLVIKIAQEDDSKL